MYTIIYTEKATKQMSKLPNDVKERIKTAIIEIKDNPFHECKKLERSIKSPFHSLRVGDYRAILTIKASQLIIFVIAIRHRKNVYKGL